MHSDIKNRFKWSNDIYKKRIKEKNETKNTLESSLYRVYVRKIEFNAFVFSNITSTDIWKKALSGTADSLKRNENICKTSCTQSKWQFIFMWEYI